MSRITKWKLEKAKVKVVFRLQFHATHIPQSGWEKLYISCIPTETGKISAKTSKTNVRNGACKWPDPIYETTRLLLDPRNKQYDDKRYKLVVGMGTSRSSILGEATINLADYADASDPSLVALPLHGPDCGTVLHVTVQLLTAKTGFREFEQQRDKGLQSSSNLNRENEQTTAKLSLSDMVISDDRISKANTKTHLGHESNGLPSVVEETRTHEEYSDSQVGCDGSSNASESYYADKHDSSSTHEPDSLESTVSGDPNGPAHRQTKPTGETDLDAAETSVSELKSELNALQSYADEMGAEAQKLAQEVTIEIASSRELAKEVTMLRSECSKFKDDLDRLKETKSSPRFTEERRACGLSLVEDRIRELQDKVFVGFRDSDLSFLHSDLDRLLGIVQDLEIGTVHVDSYGPRYLELEKAESERERLVRKMDEMECYYEALVQELEENEKRILGELRSLRNEHSACKSEAESTRHEFNDRLARLAEENRDLGSINSGLERRAAAAESALKRARLNYSIAVNQLQTDLDTLSAQVSSMFETNQNLIKQAFSESPAREHRNLRKPDESKKPVNLSPIAEDGIRETCYLDVYSCLLEETLIESRKSSNEYAHRLQLSNQPRDRLLERNRMLEADYGSFSRENFILTENITKFETLLAEYRVYKSKYDAVSSEKLELKGLLRARVSDTDDKISRLMEQNKQLEKEIVTPLNAARSEIDGTKAKFKLGIRDLATKLCDTEARLNCSLENEARYAEENARLLTALDSVKSELHATGVNGSVPPLNPQIV